MSRGWLPTSRSVGLRHSKGDGASASERRYPVMSAILMNVKAIRAHVQNGQIVLDEPVELPEGVAVEN